ncbi:FAD-dependent monooxygenase [Mucilaginibacter lacusdianchii]|uniref:FAD-dependent monooxygenase n=1 Tax=Mucilaginibacter lacusdianchii TaxID=2684211 RepID=UPI00131AD9A8|nr:FAD-dependent monooxygenase [Mucilaginibacter sp. JXJ CY 39]
MRLNNQHTEVLIVGAGPSGLMMAAQLLRYGIQPIIIDSRQGPTHQSKALAVQARSLEIYRQLGIVDEVLKGGKQAQGLHFYHSGTQLAAFPINDAGSGYTPYPYVFVYQQSKNERALLSYLTNNSCPVYWNTSLVDLKQLTNQIAIRLKTDNTELNLTCNWLIGADGAHSTVRHQLNIPFTGDTYPSSFYLADVVLDHTDDFVNLYLTNNGFTGFFPMPEANAFRVVGNLPASLADKPDLKLDEVLPHINEKVKATVQIKQCNWFTTYRLHHRMADKFNQGRCFLIGDAAHIHSPVGGQGMNTGLQDAYNLSWKLAGVIKRQLQPGILNTYATERMPVARELLKTTDRAFKIIMSQSFLANTFKKWLLPIVLKRAWKNEKLRFEFFKRISQTGISYPHSTLSLHLSQLTSIRAGDRLPYLPVYDEKKLQLTDLHAWCSKPGFTLITLGDLPEMFLFTLARWITQCYSGLLNFFHLPPSVKNQQVFDAFGIREGQTKALIIRPDMHIGLINDIVNIEMMDNYLQNVVGVVANNDLARQ